MEIERREGLADSRVHFFMKGFFLIFAFCGLNCFGADWFVATNGADANSGTKEAPWNIESAIGGKQKVQPGDTIWIQRGAYKFPGTVGSMGFVVKLSGREGAPIHIRGERNARVTLDGGLSVQEPSTHLWIWDLELLVSEPRPDKPVPPDPSYKNVNRPWGGLNVYSGSQCKFINLVIHDNSQGVSWWSGSKESELHGCIIYDNGWAGTDRGHGHAIYTQNQEGTKTISDCIMTGGFGYTIHAYGSSRAYVDHYLAEGNICYNAGQFLIGGGRPSHNIRVFTNFLYNVSMQLGYAAKTNEDCVVRGNTIANGALTINHFGSVVNEANLVLKDKNVPRPAETRVDLRRNNYDSNRANLAVFNWVKKPRVAIDASSFLRKGDKFRFLNPRDFYGAPVLAGTFSGAPIELAIANDFAAFVILRE